MFEIKICVDGEGMGKGMGKSSEAPEAPETPEVDKGLVAARMKALLGVGGVPRVTGMSEKQRQSELAMLITQLTGEVPEPPEED